MYIINPTIIYTTCRNQTVPRELNITFSQILPIQDNCIISISSNESQFFEKETIPAENVNTILDLIGTVVISRMDLLKGENISAKSLSNEIRNLKPDFSELNDEISQYKTDLNLQLPQWKLKDATLTTTLLILGVSILGTWIVSGYYIYQYKYLFKPELKTTLSVRYHKSPSQQLEKPSPDREFARIITPSMPTDLNTFRTFSTLLNNSDIDIRPPNWQTTPKSLDFTSFSSVPSLPTHEYNLEALTSGLKWIHDQDLNKSHDTIVPIPPPMKQLNLPKPNIV